MFVLWAGQLHSLLVFLIHCPFGGAKESQREAGGWAGGLKEEVTSQAGSREVWCSLVSLNALSDFPALWQLPCLP